MWALPAAFSVLMLTGWLVGNRSASGVALVLLLNWGFCAIYSAFADDATNWLALATFDYIAAIFLALEMDRRWKILVVMLYVAMLCAHVAYSVNALEFIDLSALTYFLTLTALAWAQAAAVGGWIVADYYVASRSRRSDRRASAADPVCNKVGNEP